MISKLLTEEELRKQLAELGYFLKKDIKYILTPEQFEQYEMREVEVNLRLASLVESQKKAYADYVIGKDWKNITGTDDGAKAVRAVNQDHKWQRERAGL